MNEKALVRIANDYSMNVLKLSQNCYDLLEWLSDEGYLKETTIFTRVNEQIDAEF